MTESKAKSEAGKRRDEDKAGRQQAQAPLQPQLPQEVGPCHALILALVGQVGRLQEQVDALKEQAGLNSRNSSRPPSSDGPQVGKRSARGKSAGSGRKRGGQLGHPGSYRQLVEPEQVSRVVAVPTPTQCDCGGQVQPVGQPVRHQVFDLPEQVAAQVSEYQLYRGVCSGCHKAHTAVLPKGVPRGQLGPRVLAAIAILGTRYHLTQAKVQGLLRQFMGIEFSLGAISNAHGLVSQALKEPVQQAQAQVRQAAVVHMDETRYPCEGHKQSYAWASVEPKLMTLSIVPTRGRLAAQALLGEQPTATVVSDRYAVYDYVPQAQHQVCWAHLVRDFTRIAQRSGAAGQIGARLEQLAWAVFDWHQRGKTARQYEPLKRRIKILLEKAQQNPGCKRTARTASNLLAQWDTLWLFTTRADVAPTNNAAERAIRALVLKRKISGPARSRRGLDFVARGYSVVQSCALQARDALVFMTDSIRHWLGQAVPMPTLRLDSVAVPTAATASVPSG